MNGRKFLYRASNLYTIHDRESDDDYDPDEEWTFEAWCGPQVHDIAVLQHWIAFLVGHPQQPTPAPVATEPQEESQDEIHKQTKRWIPTSSSGAHWALTVTTTNTGAHFLCSLGKSVWMAEYTHDQLMAMAAKICYWGSLEELLEALHFGVACTSYMPILKSTDKNQLELEIALESCEEYSFVAWFTLEAKQLPAAVQGLLVAQMPAKPVDSVEPSESKELPTSPVSSDSVLEKAEKVEYVFTSPAQTKGSVFKFKGATR